MTGLLANKLAMLIIANGEPQHFFSICSETNFSWGGQPSLSPNIRLKNKTFESDSSSGSILYTQSLGSEQHDFATDSIRVVVRIRLL